MNNTPSQHVTVIANEASEALGRKVAAELGLPFTEVTKKIFRDGEIFHQLPVEDIDGHDVIIVGATHDDASHQELMDLAEGSRYWNASSVNLVIPYLGYSTMERAKADSGEIPKGILRTRQLLRTNPNFVAFIDLHSESVMHAHDGNVQTANIQTDDLVVQKIRDMNLGDFALVSPDYGRSKWVARIAEKLGVPHTAADKDRYDTDQTMVGQVSSVVRGRIAIICDDMIRTGGSIAQTAERCREAGATDVMFMATHLVLAGDARTKLRNAGAQKVIGSDTYPGVESDDLLEVYSVATLIASKLKKRLNI